MDAAKIEMDSDAEFLFIIFITLISVWMLIFWDDD